MPASRHARPQPRLRWFARLFLFGVATLLAFGVAEILTRLLWGDRTILFPRYHTGATYGGYQLRRLRPKTTFQHTSVDGTWDFTTNAQGFRDSRDWKYERTPGTRRVLVLGDSHTQGFECRQDRTFANTLERRLTAMGLRSEVFNCGVSGFGTAEQLAFLENEGLKYQPDMVVLGWFANDPDDNVKAGLFALRDDVLIEAKFVHQPGVSVLNALNNWAIMRWLSENSYFYSLLFNRVWEVRKGMLSQQANAAANAEYAAKPPTPDAPVASYQYDLAAKLIERMRASCAKAGARLVIVDIPSYKNSALNFETSVPPALLPVMREKADAFLPSEEVLGRYRHVAEVFVPHGQNHISETTHLLLGMALADRVSAEAPMR